MLPIDHLDALRIEGHRIGELPPDGLAAPVEACPGWDVERLVSHVSRVHRWVTAVLAAGPDATVDREFWRATEANPSVYRRVSVTRANGLRTPELSLSMCHCHESFARS